jgi:hypothetical protein
VFGSWLPLGHTGQVDPPPNVAPRACTGQLGRGQLHMGGVGIKFCRGISWFLYLLINRYPFYILSIFCCWNVFFCLFLYHRRRSGTRSSNPLPERRRAKSLPTATSGMSPGGQAAAGDDLLPWKCWGKAPHLLLALQLLLFCFLVWPTEFSYTAMLSPVCTPLGVCSCFFPLFLKLNCWHWAGGLVTPQTPSWG